MIRMGPLVLAVAACALFCGTAFPQGAPPENEDSRFTFFRADGGFLRLDGRSGQVSICSKHPAGWLCEALPEERAAFEAEIARLQGDNAALKRVVLTHGLALPAGIRPDAAAGRPPPARSEREVNHVMRVIGNVWRRLVAMVTSVQRDLRSQS
ncbi:MAG TPA: hypothetical protein VIY51_09980 [Xanthobacteraceae bacterium]